MAFQRRRGGNASTSESKEGTKKTGKGSKTFVKLGAILEKKDGGVYLAVDTRDNPEIIVNGRPVTSFQVEDPTAKFDRMVLSGHMTEQEADEAAGKVPDYVLFEVTAVTE